MRFKNISLLLPAVLLGIAGLHAQTTPVLFNGGSQIAVTGGGVLYVEGPVENSSGLFSNAGYTTVNGYFQNGGTATGGGAATGVYYVTGDWINNDIFNADRSEVSLTGSAQNITGSQSSTFYNLTLNTPGSVKTQTIDASVLNIDSINGCEHATGDFNLFILSTDTGAIVRDAGFVSSTGLGRLYRSTKSTNTYSFPTGWNITGLNVFRPVEFTPSVADSQAFSVRFAYEDPDFDNYPRTVKAGNVANCDSVWYHLLKQHNSTAPAALAIYYNPATDGNWNSIARWQIVPEWQNLDSANDINPVASGAPYYKMLHSNWTDNGQEPHVLINGQEITVQFAFPNVFAPNGSDQVNNSSFHIINEGDEVTVQGMRIYDRWGEVVYDSNRDGGMRVTPTSGTQPTYAWDGTYEGKKQPMGNYVYTASVKINETGKVKTVSGNLALLW
jgi:gliding motility-associated-like protein